ncbi:MAG: TerB family tellurite resistance protein [Gammaproteobacteria bacterium]|nr:TerB family tellurite resistance protein [Gammaproteobacteria bacterium]
MLVNRAMPLDIETFFDIYVRPKGGRLDRHGFAARYAAAALLIACGKADADEDPAEQAVIVEILTDTFELSKSTVEQILRLANESVESDGLSAITDLVNEYYQPREKRVLLQHIWRVAFADGRIDVFEEKFVSQVASLLHLSGDDVAEARAIVST